MSGGQASAILEKIERAVAGVGETRAGTSEKTFSSGERDPTPFKGLEKTRREVTHSLYCARTRTHL